MNIQNMAKLNGIGTFTKLSSHRISVAPADWNTNQMPNGIEAVIIR